MPYAFVALKAFHIYGESMSNYVLLSATALTLCCLSVSSTHAHAIVGNRIFPATLSVEDPGVSDELNTQVGRFKQKEDGGPAAWQTDASLDYTKRLTEDFGLSAGGAWLDSEGTGGFDNFSLGAKYVFLKNTEHEWMMSAGLDADIGGTGAKRVGAESFSTLTPALFAGKGFGDLPDSVAWLKPLALTGSLGYALPTRRFSTDTDTGERSRNPQAVEWGATLQYSVPYLQQHVKDMEWPAPFSTAIPVVEFAFETPANGDRSGHTTGTVNPGVIFMGTQVQLGFEAQLPLNSASGNGVGYMAQLHFYLDNIFPSTIGRPIW